MDVPVRRTDRLRAPALYDRRPQAPVRLRPSGCSGRWDRLGRPWPQVGGLPRPRRETLAGRIRNVSGGSVCPHASAAVARVHGRAAPGVGCSSNRGGPTDWLVPHHNGVASVASGAGDAGAGVQLKGARDFNLRPRNGPQARARRWGLRSGVPRPTASSQRWTDGSSMARTDSTCRCPRLRVHVVHLYLQRDGGERRLGRHREGRTPHPVGARWFEVRS